MKYYTLQILLLFVLNLKAQQRSFTPLNVKGETEKRLVLVSVFDQIPNEYSNVK